MEDDEAGPNGYNDVNRAFLQAFMARGAMTFPEAQPIVAAIYTSQAGAQGEAVQPEAITQEDFETLVSEASDALSSFDYEIRSTLHQTRKERVYVLVNTTSDPMTQLATLHSAEEIAFVKRVIDAMFEKYNSPRMEAMCLDEMQANKLRMPPRRASNNGAGGEDDVAENGESQQQPAAARGLKSSEAEATMRSMVDEGWFERSREGLYSLSPRALTELRAWLVDSYNDPDAEPDEWQRVKVCGACREIVTVGQRCADRDCNVRIHDICEDAFWRTRRDKKCPRCETEWTGRHFVGEKAVTETDAYQRSKGRSGGRGRSSNLVEQIMQDGLEDEEDEEEDE